MAAWILSALRLLGIGIGFEVGTRGLERVSGLDIPFLGGGESSLTKSLFGGGGGGGGRRRRRKRALTQGDREDLLFLSSMMTKAGVERVAAIMVGR